MSGYKKYEFDNFVLDDEREVVLTPVTEVTASEEEISASEVKEPEVVEVEPEPVVVEKVCSVCGKKLSDKVFDFSTSTYGKPLCMKCQHEEWD